MQPRVLLGGGLQIATAPRPATGAGGSRMPEPVVVHGHHALREDIGARQDSSVDYVNRCSYRHQCASYVDPTSLSCQTRKLAIRFHAEPGCGRIRFRPDNDLATPG